MKILTKPKVPPQTCKKCGCVFEVEKEDFYQSQFPIGETVCKCPFCETEHVVVFKEQQ